MPSIVLVLDMWKACCKLCDYIARGTLVVLCGTLGKTWMIPALCSLDLLKEEAKCLWFVGIGSRICGHPAVDWVECWDSNGDGTFNVRMIPVCSVHAVWICNYD
jgi:hypothetical protein